MSNSATSFLEGATKLSTSLAPVLCTKKVNVQPCVLTLFLSKLILLNYNALSFNHTALLDCCSATNVRVHVFPLLRKKKEGTLLRSHDRNFNSNESNTIIKMEGSVVVVRVRERNM